jgi:hypothetical protein
MAEAVAAGMSKGEVARAHRVSLETVRRACIEFGVRPLTERIPAPVAA